MKCIWHPTTELKPLKEDDCLLYCFLCNEIYDIKEE
jgi:hypothetical protein